MPIFAEKIKDENHYNFTAPGLCKSILKLLVGIKKEYLYQNKIDNQPSTLWGKCLRGCARLFELILFCLLIQVRNFFWCVTRIK